MMGDQMKGAGVGSVDMNALRLLLWRKLRAGWQSAWVRRKTGRLRLADSLALGDRRSAGILEVEGRRYLIGTTAHAVTLLAELGGARSEAADGVGNGVGNGSDDLFRQGSPNAASGAESAA